MAEQEMGMGPPVHQHDCHECAYLGTVKAGALTLDIYLHPMPMMTLIARYGADSLYESWPPSSWQNMANYGSELPVFEAAYRVLGVHAGTSKPTRALTD